MAAQKKQKYKFSNYQKNCLPQGCGGTDIYWSKGINWSNLQTKYSKIYFILKKTFF